MAETESEINSNVAPDQTATDEHAELPEEVRVWLAQTPSEVVARWRMELAAGLRDDDGALTCANLHDPNAPVAEAQRISDALMDPAIRKWLATPVDELIRDWRSRR